MDRQVSTNTRRPADLPEEAAVETTHLAWFWRHTGLIRKGWRAGAAADDYVIGGETHRFPPLVDIYRRAGEKAGHRPEDLPVGLHSLGYVADTTGSAVAEYFPGYSRTFTKLGRERGSSPVTRAGFEARAGPSGDLLVGGPEDVAQEILRHSKSLGGISRVTFQMDGVDRSHEQLLHSYEVIANVVKPLVNGQNPRSGHDSSVGHDPSAAPKRTVRRSTLAGAVLQLHVVPTIS